MGRVCIGQEQSSNAEIEVMQSLTSDISSPLLCVFWMKAHTSSMLSALTYTYTHAIHVHMQHNHVDVLQNQTEKLVFENTGLKPSMITEAVD